MAKTNEYIDEAYDTLLKLSADDIERLEYEAREKAIRDYNSQMNSARRQGLRDKTISVIVKLLSKGLADADICEIAECSQELLDEVKRTL